MEDLHFYEAKGNGMDRSRGKDEERNWEERREGRKDGKL